MSKSQRVKGAAGERELAAILSDALGCIVKRTLGQARDGGADIQTGRFLWEVKRRKKLSVYEFMEQIEKACEGTNNLPVVAMRADGKDWLVMMRLEDVLFMIRNEMPER